ncbi:endothelin-2 [Scleropages formosus]|uniref:endothelin-2 n=1 Tax=Scleropages formosus TaxID=113540 RepID=UPI0010FAC829|nr:endothelin-2-like [Scleropages formosus]
MDLTTFYFLTTALALILEQEAYAASISAPIPGAEREPKVQPPPAPRRRMKRCSCENLKDIECVYFCHIGIVWVNTPGQVVPYGVGSLPVRLRRSSGRCVCTGDADDDTECLYFCSAEHRSTGPAAARGANASEPRERRSAGHVGRKNRPHMAASKT